MANLIKPCWPTNISLRKLIIPIQITGPTSTPPIGGINFLVKFKIELVGIAINNQNPYLNQLLGTKLILILLERLALEMIKQFLA